MNKLEDFKKYRYLAVIKDCRLEYFDLESVSSKHTDYVIGDIVRVEDFDLRFNAELTIKDLSVSSRSFRMYFVDFLNHYFMPYQPKFETGDIVTNHHDFGGIPKGTLFEVLTVGMNGCVDVTERNSKNDSRLQASANHFVMCNPRAYMR